MAITVRSNPQSIFAQNKLNRTDGQLRTTFERLASGARINKAADDAAGLAISTLMQHRITGQGAAKQNALEGISLIQTAEGGVEQVRSMLDRMRELAVRSGNETLSASDRTNASLEYNQLLQEIERVATTTSFNGNNLLSATIGLTFQVGYQNLQSNRIMITLTGGMRIGSLGLSNGSVGTVAAANIALGAISAALSTVNSYRSRLGAIQNRLERSIANLEADIENTVASNSRIRDVDFAEETSRLTRLQILTQSGTAVLSQANAMPQSALALLG
ncbi:MAG: flagellin [Myxococcota bacterium]|nr:flagellin [Myxococcota bacterium]